MQAALSLLLALPASPQADPVATGETEKIFNRAAAAMQQGRYDEAEAGFKVLLTRSPDSVPALGNLGALYARTHRFSAAIEMDKRAIIIDPKNNGLLLNLGLAYMKQEDYAQARTYFERLQAAGGGGARTTSLLATSMILGDAPQAGLDLLLSSAAEGSDSSALYLEAVAYARLNQMEAGQQIFARLLERSETRAQANVLLGTAFYDGKRFPEAAKSFEEALRLEPRYPGVHRELGKVYVSMQRMEDAERELRLAVSADPQDGSAAYFLGALLVQKSSFAEGRSLLDRAQTLLPDSWAAPFYQAKAAMGERHPEAAVLLLRRSVALNADEPQVFYLLARALRATGHPEEAAAAMARVEALHSSALAAEKQMMQSKVAGAR